MRNSGRAHDAREDSNVGIFVRNANPILKRLRPYTPGPTAREISLRYGIALERIVKLSSNEAPLGPSPKVREALHTLADGDELHRYPSSSVPELRNALAELLGVSARQVLPAAGSSQTWPLIIRAFSRVDDTVLWVEPSMSSYGEVAVLAEREERSIQTDHPFAPPAESIVAAAKEDASILFLSSPNNTTSRLTDPTTVRSIAEDVPNTVVVVDEHYIEAADDYVSVSAVNLLGTVPNVVVTRSLSKMYGLAGLRIGYVIATEDAVETLTQFRPSWSVSAAAETAALAALGDTEHLQQNIAATREGREYLVESLRSMDVEIVPDPQGGFLLFRPLSHAANVVTEALFRNGVMVRGDLLDGWIRVSVGTMHQNELFVTALAEALTQSQRG
jgi:histidinol-phosphate aminotransferase